MMTKGFFCIFSFSLIIIDDARWLCYLPRRPLLEFSLASLVFLLIFGNAIPNR